MNHAYTSPELFTNQLFLKGAIKYAIRQDRVLIEIDEISNQAEPGILSGTLAIELWALPGSYQGGGFNGSCLAATTIGEINSQHSIFNGHYDLIFRAPPEGTWNLVLMLREWDGQAYVTRDYVNFAHTYYQAPATLHNLESKLESKKAKVLHLAFEASPKVEAPSAELKKTAPEHVAEQQVLHPVVTETTPALTPKSKAINAKKPAMKTKAIKNQDAGFLARLNRATQSELSAIKGIPKPLSEHLVAGQPFADLKTLKQVKGLGPKKLELLKQALVK